MRALIFALIFYPGTLVYVLVGMVASLFGTAPMRAVVLGWAAFHNGLSRHVAGVRIHVEGTIPSGPYLIAVKHQSMFETIEMLRLAEIPIIVLKRELADMPLFGWMTRRWGIIRVDREARGRAVRDMLASAKAVRQSGRPIVIFPEGTRVSLGETPPLGAGFTALYRALGLPVVPIAADSGRFWGPSLPKRRGTITFKVGNTLPPGLDRDEIEARVHAAINSLEMQAGHDRASNVALFPQGGDPAVIPELQEGHTHHKTGHRSLDFILALSAIFMSAVSLAVAIHHGKVMERLVASNSLPHVLIESGNFIRERNNQQNSNASIRNVGVGPANVRSLRAFYDGRPVRSMTELGRICCNLDLSGKLIVNQQRDRFIPAGERSLLYEFPRTADNQQIWEQMDAARQKLTWDMCYCSVFEECYRYRTGLRHEQMRVERCEPAGELEFVP